MKLSMPKLILISLFLAALAFVSCGKKGDEYQYRLIEGQCDTGEHKAESKEQICAQLKDDGLNKGCALKQRKEHYANQGCGTWGA